MQYYCRRPQREVAKKAKNYKEPPMHEFGEDGDADAGAADDASDASGMSDAEAHELEDDDDADLEDEVGFLEPRRQNSHLAA